MKVATCSQGEPHFGHSSLSPPLLPPPPLLGEPWVKRFYLIFSPQSRLNQPCHLSYHCQHLPLCHHHPGKNSSVGQERRDYKQMDPLRVNWKIVWSKLPCQLPSLCCRTAICIAARNRWENPWLVKFDRYLCVNRWGAGCCSRWELSSLSCQIIEQPSSPPVGKPENFIQNLPLK